MPKENYTKYIILGILNHHPFSGYQIKKFTKSSISHFWDLSNGQIYPTLRRLEKNGLVTMKKYSKQIGPDSKVYSITSKGSSELAEWLNEPVRDEIFRSPLLLKLFFGSGSEKNIMLNYLKEFHKEQKDKLTIMELYEKNIRRVLPESPDNVFMLITVLRGKHLYEGNIKWADQAIKTLKKNIE